MISYVAVDLVCPWEEVRSGSFYATILWKSPFQLSLGFNELPITPSQNKINMSI